MVTKKKITYSGLFIGSTFGWYMPAIFNWDSTFFTKFGLSIIFGIIGVILAFYIIKK